MSLDFFGRRIKHLICIMTSWFPSTALRTSSFSATALSGFLENIDAWEQHAGGTGGFLSELAANRLHVMTSSTLVLLSYLPNLGNRHMMTARLSQDCIENSFGIVRQASGYNDNLTPTQFLITMNCSTFYRLVKTVRFGNVD